MISKRLKLIADLVDTDNVIDIGCDHALLDIYLTKNGKKCIASDISENVLKNAIKNINKYNLNDKIKVIKSDGLDNISIQKNSTIIIAGMGTHTIINILKKANHDNIDSLIIQSNNDLYLLRKYVTSIGYYIDLEKSIYDKKQYYVIIRFKKGIKKYTKKDHLFGDLDYKYYEYLLNKNNEILKKLNFRHIKKRLQILKENKILKQRLR